MDYLGWHLTPNQNPKSTLIYCVPHILRYQFNQKQSRWDPRSMGHPYPLLLQILMCQAWASLDPRSTPLPSRISDRIECWNRLKILLTSGRVASKMLPPRNHLARRCGYADCRHPTLRSFPSRGAEASRILGMSADMLRSRRIAALWTVLAILFVALFPLAIGPFTATHGPVTVFRSIVFVALLLFATSSLHTASFSCHQPQPRREFLVVCIDGCSPGSILVLRC